MASIAKSALLGMLAAAFVGDPNVLVSDGTPDPSSVPDVVAVMGATSEADGDEQTHQYVLVLSCYVGGGAAAAPVALQRASTLLDVVDAAIHADPTLAGGCRVAALDTEYRVAETIAYDSTGSVPVGRLCEITGTVTTWSGRGLLGSLASAHVVP